MAVLHPLPRTKRGTNWGKKRIVLWEDVRAVYRNVPGRNVRDRNRNDSEMMRYDTIGNVKY